MFAHWVADATRTGAAIRTGASGGGVDVDHSIFRHLRLNSATRNGRTLTFRQLRVTRRRRRVPNSAPSPTRRMRATSAGPHPSAEMTTWLNTKT